MNKRCRKIKYLLLMAVLLCMMVSGTASAAIQYPKSQVFYNGGTSPQADYMFGSISVSGLAPDETIARNSLQSSSSILQYLYSTRSTNIFRYEYIKNPLFTMEDDEYYRDDSVYIGFQFYRPGTSTVRFRIGKRTYTSKVKVLSYTNPLSKVTITGVKNGRSTNLAPMFKNHNQTAIRMQKAQKNAEVAITAAKNWRIRNVSYYSQKTGKSTYVSCNQAGVRLSLGSLAAKCDGWLSITMKNVKTGGIAECSYSFY